MGSKVKVTQRRPWTSCELHSSWQWMCTKTWTNTYYILETNWVGFQDHRVKGQVSQLMVSMGVSKLGPIDLMFIDARVKINGAYYREVLLTQKLMPIMREICSEFFIFQQGNVPAHRACETINLLKRDTCVHFTRPSATQQHRSESNSLQKIWG